MALNTYALRLVAARKHWVDFQGASLRKASLRGLDKFTWEAWIKVGAGSTSPDQRAYVESQTNSESKIRFACTPTRENNRSILRFEFQRKDGGTPSAYTYVLPQAWDDRWHHVAFSADIGERKYALFYDGVQVQKGTLSGGGTYKDPDKDNEEKPYMVGGDIKNDKDKDGKEIINEDKYIPKQITIGAYSGSGGRTYWDGKIDNVRIWKNFKNSSTFGNEMFDQTDDYATNDSLLEEWRFNEGPNWSGGTGGDDGTTTIGWVAGAYLSTTALNATATVTATDGLNFRSEPSLSATVLRALPYQTTVTVRSAGTVADGWTWFKVEVASVPSNVNDSFGAIAPATLRDVTIVTQGTGNLPGNPGLNPGPDEGNVGNDTSGDGIWTDLGESSGGDEEYTDVPEVVGPTAVGNVTRGTRYVKNTAVLMKGNSETGGSELWIGLDTVKNFGPLIHDFDRPYLGDGLYDVTPPTRPLGLKEVVAARTETSITVKWKPSEDDVYVQRYELDVAIDAGFQNAVTGYSQRNMGRATEATINGLQPGQKYFWRVRAVDSSNNVSPWASSTCFRAFTNTRTTRINYSRNPSVEEGLDHWAAVTVAGAYPDVTRRLYEVSAVTEHEYDDLPLKEPFLFGQHYLHVTNAQSQSGADSGVAHTLPWRPNDVLAGSFYVRGTGTFRVVVIPKRLHVPLFDNDASTTPVVLSYNGSTATSKTFTASATKWQRVSFTTKPDRAGMTGVEIRILSVGGDYAFDIDGMLIERGRVTGSYFDGDTNSDCYWVLTTKHTTTTINGLVVEAANPYTFGYTHLSPSATNIVVTPNTKGIVTPSAMDRQEPGVPRTDAIFLTDNEVTYRSFLARWQAPTDNNADIAGYELQVATTRSMSSNVAVFVPGYELLRVGNVLYRQILGLTPKRKYYYRVRAYDEMNNMSPWSPVVAVTTEAEPDLEPPKEVTLLDPLIWDTTSFEARWLPTYDNVGVAGYLLNVSLNTPGNFILRDIPLSAAETSFVVRGLTPAQTYYYSVRAYDDAGNVSNGLIIDPTTGKPVLGTYMEAKTPGVVAYDGDRDATVAVATAVIDPAQPNAPSGTDDVFTLTSTGKQMLVQMNLQGLAGQLLAANLLLTRKPYRGSGSPSLEAGLFGLSHLNGQLRSATTAKLPVLDWNKDLILPSVRLKITALSLPLDYDQRYQDLFAASDVTWSTQPPVQARSVTYDWDRTVASIDLTDLLSSGMRMYGFLLEVETTEQGYIESTALSTLTNGATATVTASAGTRLFSSVAATNGQHVRTLAPGTLVIIRDSGTSANGSTWYLVDVVAEVSIFNARAVAANRPALTVQYDERAAFALLDTEVDASVVVSRNVFPNTTFDVVESSVPLNNPTFQEATTRGWEYSAVTANTEATFTRRTTGGDEYGGCGALTITQMTIPAIIDGGTWNPVTNYPLLADATGTEGMTYRVSADGVRDLGSGSWYYLTGSYVRWEDGKWRSTTQDGKQSAYVRNTRRFPVTLGYTYTLSAKVRTENTSLTPRIGIRWLWDTGATAHASYDSAWAPPRANEWYTRTVTAMPPAIGYTADNRVAVPTANGQWVIAANQTGAGTVVTQASLTLVGPQSAEVEVYPWPNGTNTTQVGAIFFDDVQVTVDSGKQPVGIAPIGAPVFTRVTEGVLPFTKKADDFETDVVLKVTTDATADGLKLLATLPDEQNWLTNEAQHATVNLIENPSFESQYGIGVPTKYAPVGNAKLTRSTAQAKFGGHSLRLDRYRTGNLRDGVRLTTVPLGDSRRGVLLGSFYAVGKGGYTARLLLKYRDSATLVEGSPVSAVFADVQNAETSDWKRVECSVALNGSRVLDYAMLEILGDTKADATLYIDGVQVEEALTVNQTPRAYCDGHQYQSGCFWAGAPDQSVSFRTAFVGNLRIKTDDFDPALATRLVLRYANGSKVTSPWRGMPVLANWDNNRAEGTDVTPTPNDNFVKDTLNVPPSAWRVVSYVNSNSTWKVTTGKAQSRFGPVSDRSLQATISRVEKGQNTAAHLQSASKLFTVVPGQLVTALAYGMTDDLNLVPYLHLYYYDALNNIVGSTAQALPTRLDINEWSTLRVQGTVPAGASYCQVALKVHAKAVVYSKNVYFESIWLGVDNQAFADNWIAVTTMPVAPAVSYLQKDTASDLVGAEMEIVTTRPQELSFYVDGATIQFNAETPTTFNGSTLTADWVGEPFNSASELYAVRLVNNVSYRGDADNSSVVATFLKPATWRSDDRTDESATVYRRRRRRVQTVLPTVMRWNELSNPSFEANLVGWEASSASSLTLQNAPDAVAGSSVAEWLIGATDNAIRLASTDLIPAAEGQVWTTAIQVRAVRSNRLTPIGGVLTLAFYDARGQRLRDVLATAEAPFDLVVGGNWETVSASAIAPVGTSLVRMEIVPLRERGVLGMQGGDLFQFDAMMLYNGYRGRPYRDGGDADLYWEGVSHNSPTIFVVKPGTRYALRTVPYDEDGVAGEAIQQVGREVQTPPKPSYYTEFRFTEAVISGFSTYIEIAIPYAGAKNQNVIALADIRRADNYDWEDAQTDIDLINQRVIVRKGGLHPNVAYVLRVTVDAENGLLRGANSFVFTVTTAISEETSAAKSDGTISFNGFALNGPDAKYYWVSAQNSFSLPPLRMQVEALPRTDGAVELNSYWDRKTITMDGGVWGEDRAQLDRNLKALRAALTARKQPLRIDTLSNSKTYYIATCSGFQVTEVAGENLTSLTWSATFECADPFLYNAEETTNLFTFKANGSILTAEEILSSDQPMAVNNSGTVNALPVITINANGSTGTYAVVLYNDTTGERFFPKTTLKAGDILDINTKEKVCRFKGGSAVDYLGSFLEVTPGANQFRLSLRNLSQSRHNLLENPGADGDFNATSDSGPNIYPTYTLVNKVRTDVTGTTLTTTRDQTYKGSPFALKVDCTGSKPAQGVIFRTPKGLSTAQGWDNAKRVFTATAAVRTDTTNREWSLSKCFIRICYADGTVQELVNEDNTALSASTITMKSSWQILTFAPIKSRAKAIDYLELVIGTPMTQNSAYLGQPVTFFVDDCKLAESATSAADATLNFTVSVNYLERFI